MKRSSTLNWIVLLALFLMNSKLVDKNSCQDLDGVRIGDQIWMNKNLDVSQFRNADIIKQATSKEDWSEAGKNEEPAWCYYDFDESNGLKYGKLYNWYAVGDERGLAPEGWHIPSHEEWEQLIESFGKRYNIYKSMVIFSEWGSEIEPKPSTSGFDALPGGLISGWPWNSSYKLERAYWWTSDEIYYEKLNSAFVPYTVSERAKSIELTKILKNVDYGETLKSWGLSVRCVKDI